MIDFEAVDEWIIQEIKMTTGLNEKEITQGLIEHVITDFEGRLEDVVNEYFEIEEEVIDDD